MTTIHRLILIVSVLALAAAHGNGEIFQVNTTTTGTQDTASVSVGPDGGFIVAWRHRLSLNSNSIYGQRFAPDGSRLGGEIIFPGERSDDPHIAHAPDGSFLLGWALGSPNDAVFQLFDPAGQTTGEEIQVAEIGPWAAYPRFDYRQDGGFLAVLPGVVASLYGNEGQLLHEPIMLQGFGVNSGYRPDVAALPALRAVAVWAQGASDGDDFGIWGAVIDRNGDLSDEEFQVNSFTTGLQSRARIASNSNGLAVAVWESQSRDIRARVLADGLPIGQDFVVNTTQTNVLRTPDVAVAESGDFIIVWTDTETPETTTWARRFDSNSAPWEEPVQIGFGTGFASQPAVDVGADGQVVIAWTSGDSPGDDTTGSVLALTGLSLNPLFRDGFESGDLSAWSASTP